MKHIIIVLILGSILMSCNNQNTLEKVGDNNLAAQVAYGDKMVNKVVFDSHYKMIVFALKKGQDLQPHSAPMDAPLLMLEGSAKVTIGDKETVVVKWNGRDINISDPKHFCCKLHIVLNKLLPQRRINLPKYLHVHCHPIREGKSKMNWGETFENIRDTAITSYCRLKNSPDHGVLVTLKFYRLFDNN